MPRISIEDINDAREHGQNNIISLTAQWPDNISADERQKKFKQLFGQRALPLYKALENFDPALYRERKVNIPELRLIIKGAFQCVSEMDTICRMMESNRVDEPTIADYKIVKCFTDQHHWDLCQAYYTFATSGKMLAPEASDIIRLESRLAQRGHFPSDLLENLMMPLQKGMSRQSISEGAPQNEYP
jgi:hypothetical protein